MSADVEVVSNVPAVRERSSILLMPVMDVNTAIKRLEEFQQFCANYLQESKDGGLDGGDYGAIPGAGPKKVLMKSGADKLCEIYGLYDEYEVITKIEDWERGLFDYTLKCVLRSRRDDSMVGAGVGSCSSYESKYRWRDAPRLCPSCQKSGTIIKGKTEYGGGWICFGKKGGCGAKFKDGDKSIEGQIIGRIENPDIADSKNTVLKMAKKRAKIDAVIGVTRSSGIFTQDLDDLPPIAPSKPAPEVSTQEIEIGGRVGGLTPPPIEIGSPGKVPARSNSDEITAKASNGGGADTMASARPQAARCAKSENTSFYAEIRKALPDELKPQTEEWGRAFLRDKGHRRKDGQGSLQNVLKTDFPALLREAIHTIEELKARVAEPDPFPATDDLPF